MKTIKVQIEKYIENYNKYVDSTINYPDEADDDFSEFLNSEKGIFEYYSISQTKKLNNVLFSFIEERCFEKKILYSDKIANKIIETMKKLKEVQQNESGFGIYFKKKFEELRNSQFINRKENLPNKPGIYVFYNDGEAIYVGRTDNIKERVQMHIRNSSGSGSATFAFNLAKKDFEKKFGVIVLSKVKFEIGIEKKVLKMTRKELENNTDFKPLFIKRKKDLLKCSFKYIVLKNDILQTMLEPYLAYKLGTYPINNTFENH